MGAKESVIVRYVIKIEEYCISSQVDKAAATSHIWQVDVMILTGWSPTIPSLVVGANFEAVRAGCHTDHAARCPICRHIAEQVATTAEGIACCLVGGPSMN